MIAVGRCEGHHVREGGRDGGVEEIHDKIIYCDGFVAACHT